MEHYEDDFEGRSRWVKIGGGVLAGVVLVVAAFGVGRSTAPNATVGQRPTVGGSSGQSLPGPWRVENGVPVGYAHTPEGAVAAATSFVTVVDGQLITQPDKYRAAIRTLAAPDAEAKLRADGESRMTTFENAAGLISNAAQGRAVVFRTVPLSYHLDQFDGRTAQVSIWLESFLAVDGVFAPRETWTTGIYGVEWVAGDWKLTGTGNNTGESSGPVPVVSQPSAQTVQMPNQLKNFKGYRQDVVP